MEKETKILAEKADEYLMEMLSGGEYERIINGMIWFGSYSLRNQALIQKQQPSASDLKGMRAWNVLGRYIKSNEKGIATLSPVFDKQSNPKTARLTGFKVHYLFDVTQTEGKEYRSSRCQKDEVFSSFYEIVEGLENVLSWRTREGALIEHSLKDVVDEIEKDETLSNDQKVCKLVSDVGNRLLRRKLGNPEYPGLRREEIPNILEVMNSAVEYIVFSRLGVGDQELIEPDFASFSQEMLRRLKENLGIIRNVSQSIVNGVETTISVKRQKELKEIARENFKKLKEAGVLPFDSEIKEDGQECPTAA